MNASVGISHLKNEF